MADAMEPRELSEYTHYLRDKLKRDDITEDSVLGKLDEQRKPAVKYDAKAEVRKAYGKSQNK